MRPEPGLSARLIVLGVLAALLATATAGLLLRHQLHGVVLRSFEHNLAERSQRIAAELRAAAPGSAVTADEFGRIFSGWYWQLDDGERAQRSRSLWDSGLNLAGPAPADGAMRRLVGPRQEALMGRTQPLELDGRRAQLHVFGPVADTDLEMARIDRVLAALLGAFVVLVALLTVLQARIGLAPMRRLQDALKRVHDGDDARVQGRFGPDLDPLASEINGVLERNSRIVERSRHHAADLSHALKKPLALLGAQTHRPGVDSREVRTQVDAMAALIDRHLTRAASGTGQSPWVAAAPPLQHLVELMRQLHAGRNLDWQVQLAPDLRWRGEASDLEEMAGNLLDNAGKWARQRVLLSARAHGQGMVLQVDDDGPGLDEAQRGQAAQRGLRFDEAVEGSGLGLAIAQGIAETYGGQLQLEASPLGGLRCTLRL